MRVVVSCLVVAVIGGLAQPADAELLKCQRTILKESVKLTRSRLKELQKCEDRKLKGQLPGGTDCTTEPGTAAKVAKAETKLRTRLDKSCGGADRVCGTGDDEAPAGLGWPPLCPDFQELGCSNAIDDCDDIAECLLCIDRAAVDQTRALVSDDLTPAATGDLLACQRTIVSETRRLFDARHNALRKCWDGRYKGAHANDCPDPGDGKAAAKITKAESKARAKICRSCGGDDRACGGSVDLTPFAIGFPILCPDVAACSAQIDTLDALVDCVTCVAAFDGECTLDAGVPALTPYGSDCSTPGASVLLRLDGSSGPLDLDMGWTGFAHDLTTPWLGRLTLAGTDCTGDGSPTFGECTLSGPVRDTEDPSFVSSRCADEPWLECQIDAECTAAGASGPCAFFFGPPQPIGVGGVTSCVLNTLGGAITGTVDVEAGALAMAIPLAMDLHLAGSGQPDPCPRCIASTCDAGLRMGMPCTVHGTSTLFADDVSLDCPPGVPTSGLPILATIPLATGVQQSTLTTASPLCTGQGTTSQRCFCDTCATADSELCMDDADCPGGISGSCGGLRCLGGPAIGTPCTTPGLDPVCDEGAGGPCGTIGEPTAPNSCVGACQPVGGGNGECAGGPFSGTCGPTEGFRGCLVHSDCPHPGDSCMFAPQPCYPDNGLVGATITVTGSPDPPVNGIMTPTLAGTFCALSVSQVNASRGLPGLGRVSTTVSMEVFQP